jgi:hypothetical protein
MCKFIVLWSSVAIQPKSSEHFALDFSISQYMYWDGLTNVVLYCSNITVACWHPAFLYHLIRAHRWFQLVIWAVSCTRAAFMTCRAQIASGQHSHDYILDRTASKSNASDFVFTYHLFHLTATIKGYLGLSISCCCCKGLQQQRLPHTLLNKTKYK